jgi:hypothetical protein
VQPFSVRYSHKLNGEPKEITTLEFTNLQKKAGNSFGWTTCALVTWQQLMCSDESGVSGAALIFSRLVHHKNQLKEAEQALKGALLLHRQAQYVQGEAYDEQVLGKVFKQRDQLDEAELAFQ